MPKLVPKADPIVQEFDEIRRKKTTKKPDSITEDIRFVVKQWIRIRGPRARKNKGAEYLLLQRLEKWLQ